MASAGDYQIHLIKNVFNILSNRGFFRNQGILSLESVQEFYKIIEEEPKNARKGVKSVLDFCNQSGYHDLPYKPVITLTRRSSETGKTEGHCSR